MFDFLFKKQEETKPTIDINEIYAKLKRLYDTEEISNERKAYLTSMLEKYGYLPYPHIKALEEISNQEVLFCLDYKLKKEGVYNGEKFLCVKTSPIARRGIKNSEWIKREGHNIKLINLAALGNGNKSSAAGKLMDWLRQLIILPTGVEEKGIFPTSIYLVPFHPRNFGCAYLPTSSDVSPNLEDNDLRLKLGIDGKAQVQLFIMLSQLAGHAVIFDILPQTGRFSKAVLSNPSIARWLDVKELDAKLENCVELVCKEFEHKYDKEDVEIIKEIYQHSSTGELSSDYKDMYKEFLKEIEKLKITNSNEMFKKNKQLVFQKRVRQVVAMHENISENVLLTEEAINHQEDIIKDLIKQGLWTAPGGAWCSAGVPVYDKMSDCGSYPIFIHYDKDGNDVTEFANLDCQTPYYFVFLENGQYNHSVIDYFVQAALKFQNDYNFDGFRLDHVDHVVDELSAKNGVPISYRVPSKVLGQLNSKMKEKVPYFATIAEYMLGGENLKEYHHDMKFDVLWGNDIPALLTKTPEIYVDDNQSLYSYNQKQKSNLLTVLKTYNNQDGEFEAFDSYPAKLGRDGALFKWFSYKFLPGGKFANRPVMYVDGDESFTQTGIARTIGEEVSMERERDYDFYADFNAIDKFARENELLTDGEAQLMFQDEDGFCAWIISKEPLKTSMLVVANYRSEIERLTLEDEVGKHVELIENSPLTEKTLNLPGDYRATSEIFFKDHEFKEEVFHEDLRVLEFETIKPSEFKIFMLKK